MSTLLLISIHDGNVIGAQHGHIGERRARWATGIVQYIQARDTGRNEADREREREREHYTNIHHPPNYNVLSFTGVYPLIIWLQFYQSFILLHTEGKSNWNGTNHVWGTTLESTSRHIDSKRHWTAISLAISLSLWYLPGGFSRKQSVFGRPTDKP